MDFSVIGVVNPFYLEVLKRWRGDGRRDLKEGYLASVSCRGSTESMYKYIDRESASILWGFCFCKLNFEQP